MVGPPTLGVLGGMGPAASAMFIRRLADFTNASTDDEHPRVIMLSEPSIPDRTKAFLSGNEEPAVRIRDALLRLVAWGADLLAVPCSTAHLFIEHVKREIPARIVSIVDASVRLSARSQPEGAWLLATRATLVGGQYAERAAESQYRLLTPPPADQDALDQVIQLTKRNEITFGAELLMQTLSRLWSMKALGVLNGCTELPIAYEATGLPNYMAVSSLDALAIECLEGLIELGSPLRIRTISPAVCTTPRSEAVPGTDAPLC